MSKNKRKRRRPGAGGHVQPPSVEQVVSQLAEHAAQIEVANSGSAGAIWGSVHKLLLKTPCDPQSILRLITGRDVEELKQLIHALSEGDLVSIESDAPQSQPSSVDIPHEMLKQAMHAFRKRLKLTLLDHESKLGVGPMTSGRKADVDAIMAPREFSDDVWSALVADGKLKAMGKGFYALGEKR